MRNPIQAPINAEADAKRLGAQRVAPVLKPVPAEPAAFAPLPDDLSRDVHCILGMPVDLLDMQAAVDRIRAAADAGAPFLVSTTNLNFLVISLYDAAFRETLTLSDLCTADGAPILWIARMLGIPLHERVAGSDMFDRLTCSSPERRLSVFFFGGSQGAAEAACRAADAQSGVKGAGAIYPGYGTIDELSNARFIDAINASNAHFLLVALGAAKGQAWLTRNHHRLRVPVRAHLGATINFQAGSVRRAPRLVRRVGLEWLWRAVAEPRLWRRYWMDGCVLLRLLATRILPLAGHLFWHRLAYGSDGPFQMETHQREQSVVLRLLGHAGAPHIARAIVHFRNAINLSRERMEVDLSGLAFIDTRFLGLLLMVRKLLKARGAELILTGASSRIEKLFRLNELGYLLSAERGR